MLKIRVLVVAFLLSTAWLIAQDQSSSASGQSGTPASGQTSVQGCLQGSNGNYTLTSDSGTTYQLQGDTSKLTEHVGHEVQITGSTTGASSSSGGASPSAGAAAGASQQTLSVDNVKHISKTCTNQK